MAFSTASAGSMFRFLALSKSKSAQVVPLWSMTRSRGNDGSLPMFSQYEIPMLAKPTSLSPLLGVRFCSSTPTTTSTTSGGGLLDDPKPSELATASMSEVTIEVKDGLPQITIPLPSRNEPCIFALKPVTHTIGDLLHMMRTEDPGIDRAVVRTTDGVRVASTTSIQTLLAADFDMEINDVTYRVEAPTLETATGLTAISDEELKRMGDVRALVGQLYEALHVEEYQAQQEQKLVRELEGLKDQLAPLEDARRALEEQAERRTNNLTWLGLGMMSVQFGILARLTWWEYSWDIMEPVTYFVTYGTAMACYAYFVLTRQDYLLPDVRDRQFLISFHRRAKKREWDVYRYNNLREGICRLEGELDKLRDSSKLRPSAEALQRAAHGIEAGILGSQMNIGNIRDMLKGKFNN